MTARSLPNVELLQAQRCIPLLLVLLGFVVLAMAMTPPARAQARDGSMTIPRFEGPIVLDGMPDEAGWDAIAPLPMTMFSPTFGGEITERSEIRVAYDDTHLYVSGRLYDSNPRDVRVNTLYRDQYSGDDLLAIVLDTYNDYETASWFAVNPAGTRTDRSLSNDAEFRNGDPMNADWNTFWDAFTVQNDQGWFAELQIPFSSLGFQDRDGLVEMGMIVYRFIARKNERQLFPAIPPNWDLAFAKPSQAQRIVLEGVHRGRPVYVVPYVLGGLNRSAELRDGGASYDYERDVMRELGLDFRYSPTSNLTVDLTANTDFAQVEVDDQQVNLTRFSLFFPEKRQFFQERSAIFEFTTGDGDVLFHSRRIGLVEEEPVRLIGGARVVGRVGKTDFGFLNMQTAAEDTLPAENFGVLRFKREIFNPYSTIGAMLTTRAAEAGDHNIAVGVDGMVRVVADEYFTLQVAQTIESNGPAPGDLDAALILARWERRDQDGFSYSAEFIRSGSAYNPGLGFETRDDFTALGNTLRYQWFPGARSPFRSIALEHRTRSYVRNGDQAVESAAIEPELEIELKGGSEISLSLENSYESVRDSFEVAGDSIVVPGNYWFHEGELRYEASRAARVRPSFTLSAGTFYDGTRLAWSFDPAWNPSRHVELSAQYEFNAIRFPARDASLDVHLARVRVQMALDIHLSLATFVQYSSSDDVASVNARLRYNFSEGRDLWVVYNETFNTQRAVVDGPNMPWSQQRALIVKYTHTLVW